MIDIINPFFLYALCFIGALGIIWSIKFSNNQKLRELVPINKLRQAMVIILLTNFLVLSYLFIHTKFISHMLIDPGFIKSSDGSGGGFYWNDDLSGWNQLKLKNFEIYKSIKELLFGSINIFVFLVALFLRNRNNSKLTSAITEKSNLTFTVLLIFFSIALTFITLGGIMLTIEEYFIWEGG